MTSYGKWIVAAGLAAATVPAWSAAEKPLGGICECGPYTEGPAQCAPLAKAKRQSCISNNLSWLGKCNAWRSAICQAPAAEPAKAAAAPAGLRPAPTEERAPVLAPPATAAASTQPVVAAPIPPAPAVVSPALAKFGGAWKGTAQCRFDTWKLSMNVAQLADGSLLSSATTSQAAGSFSKIDLNGNDVVLHYNSWVSEILYTGHLAGPNRIEGSVHVAGRDCSWFLTR